MRWRYGEPDLQTDRVLITDGVVADVAIWDEDSAAWLAFDRVWTLEDFERWPHLPMSELEALPGFNRAGAVHDVG